MLNKKELERTLAEWNFWDRSPPTTIPRKALRSIKGLQKDLVLVIQGVRRSGKSTLLAQLMSHLYLDPRDCTFVNFEVPRLSEDLSFKILDHILEMARERRRSKRHYFFFDEIQNVSQWQKWLHAKMERPSDHYFVITGSNSSLLSGDLASSLTGRHMTVELFPFDYEETLLANPNLSLEDHFRIGGFPRAQNYEEPDSLLREYFSDIIERDVRRYVSVRSTLSLVQLVKMVFETTGSETSQRSLAKTLGVTADTVGTYLNAGESAYILLPCPYFTFSERQRAARNKKYYPVDIGLRNAVISKTGRDKGKGLETAVFLELRKRYRHVFYWRDKGEIDFVVQTPEGVTPYQVSWEGQKERHDEALKAFYKAFPEASPPRFITAENFRGFLASEGQS